MPEHRRRRATKRSAATSIGPKGCGAMSHPLAVVLRDARRASAKHRWGRCIVGRSRKLVRNAGSR